MIYKSTMWKLSNVLVDEKVGGHSENVGVTVKKWGGTVKKVRGHSEKSGSKGTHEQKQKLRNGFLQLFNTLQNRLSLNST